MLGDLFKRTAYFFYRVKDIENRIAQIESHLGRLGSRERFPARLDLSPGELVGKWSRLGQWQGYKRARALAVHKDVLYVGLDGGVEGRAKLVAYDGEWSNAGGQGNGWSHGLEVHTVAVHDDLLYAGISSFAEGAQVWRTDGHIWERVGNWPDAFSVSSMVSFGGKLVIALLGTKSDTSGLLYAYDGQWTKLADKRVWGQPYQCAYELHEHLGSLYAGFIGHGWFGGHVWRVAPDFELIGGDGCQASWDSLSTVLRLRSVGSHLVALMNREPQAPGAFFNAWAYDGDEWAPLLRFPDEYKRLYSFNALVHYRGKLIVGAGGRPAGKASVFYLDGEAWRRFGGEGVNGSWSPRVFRDQFAPLANRTATEYVYQFCQYRGDLIAGFGASPGCGQVWRFSPV